MDNSAQVIIRNNVITAELVEATSILAENLAQSEPFIQFQLAASKLNADIDAKKLVNDIEVMRQKIQNDQKSGIFSESDLKQLRELQYQIGMNETIQSFELSQEYAVAFLKEINQEISSLIGIDFATLARRSGGCC